MAYRFNMDLQELRRLMGWIEWRCDVLHDHPQLPLMVHLVRAHVQVYHNLFDTNPHGHSMVEEAKTFGHRMLKGVGDSIVSMPKSVFVAENAEKVGAELEGVLYLGLNEPYNYHCLEFCIEFFFLVRDVRRAFRICQDYNFYSDRTYDLTALRACVQQMEHMRLGMHAYR